MARTLPALARQELFKRSSGMVLPILLDIYHASFGTIRVVNNNVELSYGGNTYVPFPFRLDPPDETEGGVPSATLTIDAIDQSVIELIRGASDAPTVTARAMFYYDNGSVTFEPLVPWTFIVKTANYTAETVTLQLAYDDRLDNAMGPLIMSPSSFPGIF